MKWPGPAPGRRKESDVHAPHHRPPAEWHHRPTLAGLGLALACAWPGAVVHAADGPVGGIYSCTDAKGRKLTSDRPIADCLTREQRLLNRDGSVRTVVPPTLSPEERAQKESDERRMAEQRAAHADAVRRDRNLMARFPNENTHRRAREAALDTVRLAMKATDLRLKELARERRPLLDESEFYKGRALPARLKQQIDANDAGVEAQHAAAATQQAEMVRINALYDLELDRLRKLWAGTPPGSLGPASVPTTEFTGAPVNLRNASQQ
jgi:hypothetical protein